MLLRARNKARARPKAVALGWNGESESLASLRNSEGGLATGMEGTGIGARGRN